MDGMVFEKDLYLYANCTAVVGLFIFGQVSSQPWSAYSAFTVLGLIGLTILFISVKEERKLGELSAS